MELMIVVAAELIRAIGDLSRSDVAWIMVIAVYFCCARPTR